ncbi:PspC domain-containing protein [Gallalistipes aquisgranensis]|uniref:PspC domain-containing protein n=1 Tax=Gallalistipes aquisgranensis TaxID=2779358 RepID=UPI001CF8EBFE|nr:PspC domain-containing protein [Gallalistipes aquisgranensis]MBE5034409.1 PspC domain-containing protein [Gallalistipes aquisgranensis]
MKETVQISISGIAFFFDGEAYLELKAYLDRLEKGYRNDPDGAEIVADIEARIAEIILGKQEPDRIVDPALVREIIGRMGFPEGTELEEESPAVPKSVREKFSRRLYRNPDGARLGGVCNGIATFLGIDPVWVRLAVFSPLVLLIFTATLGLGFLSGLLFTVQAALLALYLLLWFAVPTARTPRQRLEMRGERITASSIEKSFREEFSSLSADTPRNRKTATVWAEVVWVMGRIALFGIKALSLIFSLFLIAAALSLIIGFVVLLTSWDRIPNLAETFSAFQGISPGLFLALCVLIVLLPVLLLLYLLLRLVFDLPTGRGVLAGIFGLWIIVTVFVCFMAVRNSEALSSNAERRTRNELPTVRDEQSPVLPDSSSAERTAAPDSLSSDSLRTL